MNAWRIASASGHTFSYYQTKEAAEAALRALKRVYSVMDYYIEEV